MKSSKSPPLPSVLLTPSQLTPIAIGLSGLQLCWSIQIGYVTKTMLQLGLLPKYTGIVWLAGPIAGILVQPIVGSMSDACTSPLGRRRPFIVGGTLLTCLCLFIFAYAPSLGALLHISPLAVAIAAFWALDFAINGAQAPLRALMADRAPIEQQTLGNSYLAFATGVGNVAGAGLGSLPLARYLPFFASDGQALYVIAIFFLLACVACLCYFVEETPLALSSSAGYSSVGREDSASLGMSLSSTSAATTASSALDYDRRGEEEEGEDDRGIIALFFAAPHPFLDVFAVQLCTWAAYFTLFIYATSYVGAEVFQGVSNAAPGTLERDLYDEGVRLGNFALALQALVSMAVSLVVPILVEKFSAQTVMFAAHIMLGAVLSSTLFLHSYGVRYIVVIGFALIGFPWAVTMAVPWGMASAAVLNEVPKKSGQYCEFAKCVDL